LKPARLTKSIVDTFMPKTSPLHDAVWARQLAEQLKTGGHPVKRLLAEAGIVPRSLNAEGGRLPFNLIATFFELAADAAGDNCLGLRFGQTRDARDAGLIGYVGLSSPTVLGALRNLDRYRRVFSDAVEIRADALEETGILCWNFCAPPTLRKRQLIEFSATNLVRFLRKTTGRNLTPEGVSFSHPRNERIREFERFFGCPVDFATPENRICFKLQDIHLPIHTADDRLLSILEEHCRIVLDRHDVAPPSIIERVERLVVDRLTTDEAKAEVIATELGMSRRTLARRLAELGTSFNAIVEALRQELALTYLRDSNLSQTEIAFLLGYTEVSSFNHAFRRWTGKTPGQVRQGAEAMA
jgi:AraC-like DNA-binding protein